MNKLATIALSSLLVVGCTSIVTTSSSYTTVGHAKIRECDQMVFPDGQGEGKEAIGFNCREYESKGVSTEFAGIVKVLFGWVPWPW